MVRMYSSMSSFASSIGRAQINLPRSKEESQASCGSSRVWDAHLEKKLKQTLFSLKGLRSQCQIFFAPSFRRTSTCGNAKRTSIWSGNQASIVMLRT